MKGSRRVLIIVAAVVVVLAAALYFLVTNIDSIVKAAIEKYGSEVTKTDVRVSSVKIKLSSGEGAVSELTIANPPGFSSPYVFSLAKIRARIDARSVTGSPIVIDEIIISSPHAVSEITASGASNINILKRNVQQSMQETEKKEPKGKKHDKETRYHIRRLVIESGRINVRVAALGDKPETLTLRRIEMTGIGKGGGATANQVAEQVLSSLLEEVALSAARHGAEQYLNREMDKAVKGLWGK